MKNIYGHLALDTKLLFNRMKLSRREDRKKKEKEGGRGREKDWQEGVS